jgi:hypothetical protein
LISVVFTESCVSLSGWRVAGLAETAVLFLVQFGSFNAIAFLLSALASGFATGLGIWSGSEGI